MARDLGVTVHEIAVRPFRFDDARTAGLALLPDWDDCFVITLYCDEILVPGWRSQIEAAVAASPSARRLSYLFTWSWVDEAGGLPDVQFHGDRCVSRFGWRWRGPVHEVLVPAACVGGDEEVVWAGFGIEHYPDAAKPRSGYLELLELAVAEEPDNPRQAFYLGRE